MKTIIGITGASGSAFAVEFLKNMGGEKYLIASRWGKSVLAQETKLTLEDLAPYARKVFSNDDLGAPLASGANAFDAMVIVPCSASTLSKIACGIADSLLTRAAAVALKERRKLVLCLRETPLSTPVLENMLKLSQAGAVVMPISPSFYQDACTIEDQARLFAERIRLILEPDAASTGWKAERL
jgi:4-hydroxy-3-polyprenylbenzoate decarboxylase